MRLVVVESPYAGDIARNERYARACLADSLARGEAPLASHLLYTQPGVLNDAIPGERRKGINAGFAWGAKADLVAVYVDLGISAGMQEGIDRAMQSGQTIELRQIAASVLYDLLSPPAVRICQCDEWGIRNGHYEHCPYAVPRI